MAGQVIDVNTATGVIPGTNDPNGYGYAIPINTAMEVVDELLAAR